MRRSSCRRSWYPFLVAYQRLSHCLITPSRNEVGCTFCPMCPCLSVVQPDGDVARPLADADAAAHWRGSKPLRHRCAVYENFADAKIVHVLVLLLASGVRRGAFEH